MGLTSENVAERYGISRQDQDLFAAESHRRAARARQNGHFQKEIIPVDTFIQEVDRQGANIGDGPKNIRVTEDDGIRSSISLEALAKLKSPFKEGGASTAGNSSQISEGAAALVLMRRSIATALGLLDRIIEKYVLAKTVGCRPDEMGIGPALVIPALLGQLGLNNTDVDRWKSMKHLPTRASTVFVSWA
ncbi:unnamed protein product, partial [Clonostachys chloroleuca]